MPTRHAKPRGEAERGVLAASSRPTRCAASARTPTDNDPELAQALMDMDDQDIETQVSSAVDANEDFLSPDEVLQGESTSDAENKEKDSAEERDDEAKNGQWQVAMSLRQRKRIRKQEHAASDDSVARGETESNSSGARTLAEEQRGRASERGRRRTRAAPLPKNDMKIIMRPRPGLVVKELKAYQVARAIEHASGDPEACNSHKFLLRLRNGSNIIIASTPYEDVAERILKIKTLELNGTNYPVNTYISTPAGYLKGVVHGLERETPEAELLSHLRVRTQGVTIVQARMLGQSQTAVITFDGPILPRFVYYYGGEMPCVPYQPTRQYCKLCKSQGHRTDVCPTPMTKACSNCRLRDPPEDHTCDPECALCGGRHPTAASECTKKLKRVPQKGRSLLSHQHSTPKTTGILKRRWFSTDREDSAPPSRARSSSRSRSRSTSRSRSGSRDCSNSRNGGHKQAQAKQQQHKGKKAQKKEEKNQVSWAAKSSQHSHQTPQLTRLERELEIMRVRIGDLERENRELKKQQTQHPQQNSIPTQSGQKSQTQPNAGGDSMITSSMLKETLKEVIPTVIEQVMINVDRKLEILDKKIQAQHVEFTKALRKHATGINIREKAEKIYNRPGLSAMNQETHNG